MRQLSRDLYLRIFGSLRKPVPGVHLINSHYVTANPSAVADKDTMRYFLSHLSGYASFLTLDEAVDRIARQKTDDKVYVSFTFDDGYKECHSVIAPALEEFDTRGAFFINGNYPESDSEYRKRFHDRVIVYTKDPMNWEEIGDLHKRGHIIGSHTMDHYNMAQLSPAEAEKQVAENKSLLEKKLNYQCEHFAWPFGAMHHFPSFALEITEKYHKYIYSGTNYKQYYSNNKRILNRRHLEPGWPNSHIRYFLSNKRQ